MSDTHMTRTEPESVAARPIIYVALGFLVFVGVCLAGIFYYYSAIVGARKPLKPEAFPAPQLQRTPLSDLETLQKRQQEQLSGYAWVDKEQGIVRVPIERAMQIVASKGQAAFGPLDDLNKAPAQPTVRNETAKANSEQSYSIRGAAMKNICAAVALLLFSLPCKAALSPKQLSTAILNPSPGASLPLDIKFTNSNNAALSLGEALGNKPAALVLVNYTCRFICGTTLAIAAAGLSQTGLTPGQDYSLVVAGINPKDKPADAEAMKEAQLAPYPGLRASALFLNGDATAIARVTRALNYIPVYDAERDEYAHPLGAVILTPDGRVSRVISGLDLRPGAFRAALAEAGRGALSSLVEGIRLLCYGHRPLHGAYNRTVQAALMAGGLITLAGLAGAAAFLIRRGGGQS